MFQWNIMVENDIEVTLFVYKLEVLSNKKYRVVSPIFISSKGYGMLI